MDTWGTFWVVITIYHYILIIERNTKIEEIKIKLGIPLYIQIRDNIKRKIETSELKKGDKIPSEKELSDIFKVSKITVIRALRDLVSEGLIVRKQGKGSFVENKPKNEKNLVKFADFIKGWPPDNIEHKILEWNLGSLENKIFNRDISFEEREVLEIVRVGYDHKEPISLEYIYIPKSISQHFLYKRKLFENKYIYDIYKSIPDISLDHSKLFIKPIIADKKIAKILKIRIGDPLLLWERVTFSKENKIVEFSRFYEHGLKNRYFIDFYG